MKKFLDSASIQILMTLVTLYALVGDDLKIIYGAKEYDNVFVNLTIISFFLFMLELIFSCFGYDKYILSFFFWLDLVSTASLITDIKPLMDWFAGIGEETDEEGQAVDSADTASLARASRGAKLGSKAGRLTRVIRIIRLVRVVKLYKSANHALAKQEAKISQTQ